MVSTQEGCLFNTGEMFNYRRDVSLQEGCFFNTGGMFL